MKHLSPEAQVIRNEGIITDYKQGLTRQELCMKYGMSCVGRVLKNAGIKFAKKVADAELFNRIKTEFGLINK